MPRRPASSLSPPAGPGAGAERAQALRAFNRLYTQRIGVVGERVLGSPYSLAETRVLWELAHADAAAPPTATALARALGLDLGYTSRLVASLRRRGLVRSAADRQDRRRRPLRLSAAGQRAFAPLERRSQAQTAALLAPLSEAQQRELVGAAGRIGALLHAGAPAPIELRAPCPGDMGWVASRHGALYAQEFGWDWRFEALVARICADFIERFDARREACWIAHRAGAPDERLGSIFLVQARDDTTGAPQAGWAQLRMLLLEPEARGTGLGKRLVRQCETFARNAGCYRGIRLWTNSVLLAARGIYEREGYRLVKKERHRSFGKVLVGETWELLF